MDQQRRNHQARGERDDDNGFALAGEVEAESMGLGNPAASQGPDQGRQHDHGQDVQIDAVNQHAGRGQDGFAEGMPDGAAEDEYEVGKAEGQEPPENGGVADAGKVEAARPGINAAHALQHFALSQDDDNGARHAGERSVEAGHGKSLQHQTKHAAVNGKPATARVRAVSRYTPAQTGMTPNKLSGGTIYRPVLEPPEW